MRKICLFLSFIIAFCVQLFKMYKTFRADYSSWILALVYQPILIAVSLMLVVSFIDDDGDLYQTILNILISFPLALLFNGVVDFVSHCIGWAKKFEKLFYIQNLMIIWSLSLVSLVAIYASIISDKIGKPLNILLLYVGICLLGSQLVMKAYDKIFIKTKFVIKFRKRWYGDSR